MSDILKKMVMISDGKESNFVEKRRFKKTVNLKLKILNNNSSPSTPTSARINGSTNESFSALEELLQCGICLERLSHPRMLPCQHTFCLGCLKTHVTAKNLKLNLAVNESSRNHITVNPCIPSMTCPVCQRQVNLDQGIDSLEKLPKNLYLQSLLKVVEGSQQSPKIIENFRCVNCQTISQQQEQVCQHCMQIFCSVCWNEHLAELESNLSVMTRQLRESEDKLKHKLENFVSRCETLEQKIKTATIRKVDEIIREEKRVLNEVSGIKTEGGKASNILLGRISDLNEEITTRSQNKYSSNKVTTYLNLHRETSKLLEQINHFGDARVTFDPDTFKLEQYSEGIYNDEEDQQPQPVQTVTNPFESVESMTKHYKSRSFTPKLLWKKCPRPAGLGIPPWDDTKIYIAATDAHDVLIMDKSNYKLIDRISHPEMMCPSGIAFSRSRKEIFVSDKWNQCVHVFSSEGDFNRSICFQRLRAPDGIAMGPNEELIICDTGNDRVLMVDPGTGEKLGTIGVNNGLTTLNFPTSVTVYGTNIIIADSGNNRIKIYNSNGDLIQEFGSFGKNPGQFRSPEVVAVDQLGFILVGDAGNARVQVFKPDGTLVKIFGSKGGFGWVSGILVTANLDIIATDIKTKTLRIF